MGYDTLRKSFILEFLPFFKLKKIEFLKSHSSKEDFMQKMSLCNTPNNVQWKISKDFHFMKIMIHLTQVENSMVIFSASYSVVSFVCSSICLYINDIRNNIPHYTQTERYGRGPCEPSLTSYYAHHSKFSM